MHTKIPNTFTFISQFKKEEILSFNKNIGIIFRNYKNKITKSDIIKIKQFCKINNRKFYLANNIKLAVNLNLNGAYIPSFNKNLNFHNKNLKKNFKIIGSAHNFKEIKIKEKQGCKEIFISPIFYNPKNDYFLEIVKFNNLNLATNIKTIALGGINEKNLRKLKSTKVIGFAGISWIKKNRPKIN